MAGCYAVRCLLPLMENGWDGDVTSFLPRGEKSAEAKKNGVMNADVVVFHRPEHPDKLKLAKALKELGKKIVFDNDDTYKDSEQVKLNKYMNKERIDRGLTAINGSIDAFIKEADLVTTTNEFLADEYRKINPNVVVLKNCIDPFLFDEPLRNEEDVVRIGITGSVGLTADLDVLEPIVRLYEHDPRVRLVFFSLYSDRTKLKDEIYHEEYKILDSMNVEWVGLADAHEYYDTLNKLKLDIQIIPRKNTYFNRCKSNLKFLESSMLEIPCVAQAFSTDDSPYQQNKEDRNYLLLADTLEEWQAQIEKLITDKELRRDIGRKAREYVEKEYNIQTQAHLWEEAYKTL
jgi:glycosyltransferase involved in cell wall biosynthesis